MNQNVSSDSLPHLNTLSIPDTARIIIRRHAFEQMYTRKISEEEIKDVVHNGEIIESYPDDYPFHSYLICGTTGSRWLHIVAAFNEQEEEIIIITSYEPDEEHFTSGKIRRKE